MAGTRVDIIATYSRCKSVRGYRGYKSHYVFEDVCLSDGTLIVPIHEFTCAGSFKGKGFRAGDRICMTVTMARDIEGKVLFSRPFKLSKME